MPLLVDATGVLNWGAQPPTGIQRVEFALCKAALEDKRANLVAFDRGSGYFAPLTDRERDYLRYIVDGCWEEYGDLRQAQWRFADLQLKYFSNEGARRLAASLTGKRSGACYSLFKTVIRFAQWIALAARRVGAGFAVLVRKPSAHDISRLVLLCHHTNRKRGLDKALRACDLKPVFLIHDVIPVTDPELAAPHVVRSMRGLFERVMLREERIIAISHATRDALLQWNDAALRTPYRREVPVARLGAALLDIDGADAPVVALEDRPFALYCSTFEKRKNHPFLLEVWQRLIETHGDSVPHLALVGRPSNTFAQVQRMLVAAPALAAKVHLLTDLGDPELRWAYRNARFGLFPSSAEGWGLGVAECLANGLPVLHSNVPALNEAAQDLMPALDVCSHDDWVRAIGGILCEDKLDELRSRAGQYRRGGSNAFANEVFAHMEAIAAGEDAASRAVDIHQPLILDLANGQGSANRVDIGG
ncbi:glycosyltransferase [Nitratireductor basaltis]|uniref:Group 1 glycosyl transferase n=1 Tax=Nitratireductor basaltis TaxID=472175 RepID=A0A084U9A4_9HYPH|nr:glycosyltransferase [Nitratireductor basaltis]KFB09540.1 Group 1 glycosyl transferase [Nitratireductor basaltis]